MLFLIGALHGGGAEKVLVDTVSALDSEKYAITVQTLFGNRNDRETLPPNIRYKSIISCPAGILRRVIAKFLFFVLGAGTIYRLFVRDDYDYEIAFLEGMPTKILSASTNKKSRKIAWIHTDLKKFPNSYHAFGSQSAEAEAYNHFDKIFCVSKAVEDAFCSKYPSVVTPTSVLYNVLDDQAILKASTEPADFPTDRKPCFISVGRLIEQKGYDRLLKIHHRLIKEGFLHALIIVGDGKLYQELKKYIVDNNLQNTAFLLGFQKNPYKFISKADCFVCSSYAEGFSTVVSESVLCGTPVIATDVAGNREPEEMPRCSMIFENDEEAFYKAMRTIINQPEIINEYRKELPARQQFLQKKYLVESFENSVFRE